MDVRRTSITDEPRRGVEAFRWEKAMREGKERFQSERLAVLDCLCIETSWSIISEFKICELRSVDFE